MKTDGVRVLESVASSPATFRDRAIVHYHDLLAADKTLSTTVLEKLRASMRVGRLTYGERPIGVALRPHLMDRKQFELLTTTAESIASALEEIAAAAVQSPALMTELGLTESEQKVAMINPGFNAAAITTRLDGFVHGERIKFVEYNAENPSSVSDQEGLNRLLSELPAMSIFAQHYGLQQFSPMEG